MSSSSTDFQKLKQQHDLASFYEGRIRDLGTPITMGWQTLPLFISVVALFGSNKVLSSSGVQIVAVAAVAMAVALMFLIRSGQEHTALQVKAQYEQDHQLLFGEAPRIELIGFALPMHSDGRTPTKRRRGGMRIDPNPSSEAESSSET